MSNEKNKVRHDFINNAIRLEVLNKLITEAIEGHSSMDADHLDDLESFLKNHLELTKKVKDHYL